MTRWDFYKLAIESLLPPGVPDCWVDYRAGRMTHFEALQYYFAQIRASEAEVLAVVDRMELDPGLPGAIERLRQAGWRVVVTSAGCEWYIRRLLAAAGVQIEVHANPGRFVAGKGLVMELPTDSPYFSANFGIDKSGVVREFLKQGQTVAFAGDGFPDAEAARLVSADVRFARGDLATVLRDENLPFLTFESWSHIADCLLQRE